jgi:transposase
VLFNDQGSGEGADMLIIGCDYHPRFQQIAFLNTETGEYGERHLEHPAQAEEFYRSLAGQVRVGMEASGHALWFQRLLAALGHELWIGNPAEIRASVPRKQKTDTRDCRHLLKLLLEERFPRIWVPTAEQRDLRQLVLHRHRLVQMRTRVKNQLKAVALNEGLGRKPGLWSRRGRAQFETLPLPHWTARRRQDGLELLDELVERTHPLDQAVKQEAGRRPEVARLMTHPGVGEVTALAFVLTLGEPGRFACGNQVASYLGLIPAEHGRAPAAGSSDQAGQCAAARAVDGSGARGGENRSRAGSLLSSAGDEEEPRHCRRGRGPETGHTVVVDVASRARLWGRGSSPVRMQGKPG